MYVCVYVCIRRWSHACSFTWMPKHAHLGTYFIKTRTSRKSKASALQNIFAVSMLLYTMGTKQHQVFKLGACVNAGFDSWGHRSLLQYVRTYWLRTCTYVHVRMTHIVHMCFFGFVCMYVGYSSWVFAICNYVCTCICKQVRECVHIVCLYVPLRAYLYTSGTPGWAHRHQFIWMSCCLCKVRSALPKYVFFSTYGWTYVLCSCKQSMLYIKTPLRK